jgi:hypothetical protein
LKIEDALKRRVAVGNKIQYSKLMEEMVSRFNNQYLFDRALTNLIKN